MKEGWCGDFFPSVEVVGANHGGDARPAGGDGVCALLRCGRRKKKARLGGLATGPIGPKVEANFVSK
jgi:hypothetical protein